jgi:cobalt-zinc-cadmium efflux system membrane fusion protein
VTIIKCLIFSQPISGKYSFEGKQYLFMFKGNRKEGNQTMSDFEMLEVLEGNEEENYVAVSLVDKALQIEDLNIVLKDAFTLLAKAKNSEE